MEVLFVFVDFVELYDAGVVDFLEDGDLAFQDGDLADLRGEGRVRKGEG